jgi:spore maturation protein SpmA/spore maturation protein SpmB
MLNFIWLALIGLAVMIAGLTGRIDVVSTAAIERAKTAVDLALGLIGIMTLWLGLMRLAEKAGLVHRLGLALRPIMTWLFPEVPPDHPAMGAMILNVAANMLGLNNAATPLGLRAMAELQSLNQRPGIATNAMCMLLAINTSSITLIPVTVIGILQLAHGRNPTLVIGTSIAASVIAHIAAITACKLLEKTRFYRLPALPPETAHPPPLEKEDLRTPRLGEGDEFEKSSTRADVDLPWAPGSGLILAAFGGLFVAIFILTAFPEVVGPIPPGMDPFAAFMQRMGAAQASLTHDFIASLLTFLRRLLDTVSILAIPFLIFFFPLYAALRRIPVYEEFVEGGKEGFQVIIRILPYIVGMLVATGMFTAAGGMEIIKWLVSPLTSLIGFPADLVPLAVIRPFSGTASLPLLKDIVDHSGPDSFLSLAGGTMYGCSETTFYVIAIYFGSVGIRKTRHAIPAGLVADVVGPLASVLICRLVLG